jgi:cytochrome c
MYFLRPDYGVSYDFKFWMEKHMANVKAYFGVALGVAALLALPACSKKAEEEDTAAATPTATETAAPAAAAPAADSTDTLDGTKFASFTTDVAAGEKVFLNCKTCHAIEPGKNMVGPSLHGLQGRKSGSIAGYSYSTANKNSGITWSNEKLFQYLENPQRVIPGTKMTYTGVKDAQQRANVVAYLDTLK